MIIPVWLGISKILIDLHYSQYLIGIFTLLNLLFLVLDVFDWFDEYFPSCLIVELLLIIIFYYQTLEINRDINIEITKSGLKGIVICCSSGTIWLITEINCNEYLIFGHVFWHIGMSTGLCYIINYFDVIKYPDKNPDKNPYRIQYSYSK